MNCDGGSGIVAADVDADHLPDLVLVSGGSLGVMKAALEGP